MKRDEMMHILEGICGAYPSFDYTKAVEDIWFEDLGRFDAEVVREAVTDYRRFEKFAPKISDVFDRCKAIQGRKWRSEDTAALNEKEAKWNQMRGDLKHGLAHVLPGTHSQLPLKAEIIQELDYAIRIGTLSFRGETLPKFADKMELALDRLGADAVKKELESLLKMKEGEFQWSTLVGRFQKDKKFHQLYKNKLTEMAERALAMKKRGIEATA